MVLRHKSLLFHLALCLQGLSLSPYVYWFTTALCCLINHWTHLLHLSTFLSQRWTLRFPSTSYHQIMWWWLSLYIFSDGLEWENCQLSPYGIYVHMCSLLITHRGKLLFKNPSPTQLMHMIENSGYVDDVYSSSSGHSLASHGLLMKK